MTGCVALGDLSRSAWLGTGGEAAICTGTKLLVACPDTTQAAESHDHPQPGETGCRK